MRDKLLIKKVREHEVLYNPRLTDYRNQDVRQTSWEEIGRKLNIPSSQAKARWDKLRRCFCNARNRRRVENKSGAEAKNMKYEQQMAFILPFLDTRKTHSNLHESQASVNLKTQQEDMSEESDIEEDTRNTQDEINQNTENELDSQNNEAVNQVADLTEEESVDQRYKALKTTIANRKKLLNTPAHQIVQILKETSDLRKRRYEEKNNARVQSKLFDETLDETDMFFLSMARMTKKLPKLEQAQIKLGLSNAVMAAEIKVQNSQTFHSEPSFHQNRSHNQQPIRTNLYSASSSHPMQQQSFISSPLPRPSTNMQSEPPTSDNISSPTFYEMVCSPSPYE